MPAVLPARECEGTPHCGRRWVEEADVIVFNMGHHYHNVDPAFMRCPVLPARSALTLCYAALSKIGPCSQGTVAWSRWLSVGLVAL